MVRRKQNVDANQKEKTSKCLLLKANPVDIMNIKSPVSHKHGRLLAGTGSVLHLTMRSMYVKLHRS